MHTGLELAGRAALVAAVERLPFSPQEAVDLLGVVAAEAAIPPPIALDGGSSATTLLLAPLYPALRAVTVRARRCARVGPGRLPVPGLLLHSGGRPRATVRGGPRLRGELEGRLLRAGLPRRGNSVDGLHVQLQPRTVALGLR